MPKKKQQKPSKEHVRFIGLVATLVFVTSTVTTANVTGNFLAQNSTGIWGNYSNSHDDDDDDNGIDLSRCGNGKINRNRGEECDDGEDQNGTNGHCSEDCQLVDDFTSSPVCGNGAIEGDEECDDGSGNGIPSESMCTYDCTKREPKCGNGVREGSEECDDGNGDNEDGCTNECTQPQCGDGFTQPSHGEECDEGDRNGSPNGSCDKECYYVDNSTTFEECGNGILESGEECDDGNNDDADKCSSNCQRTFCGDSIPQEENGEECDEGSTNGSHGSECSSDCQKVEYKHDDDNDDGTTVKPVDTLPGPGASPGTKPVQPVDDHDDDEDDHKHTTPPWNPIDRRDEQKRPDDSTVLPAAPEPRDSNEAIEALRKKREKMQQDLEESMRRANEEARKRAAEQKAANEQVIEVVEQPESDLRCFDSNGELTADRTQCDNNQEQFLRPDGDVSEEEARKEIAKKLLGDDVTERKRQELLKTMADANRRLHALLVARSDNENSKEVRDYLQASIDWLDRSITYFSEEPRNIEEISQMVGPVKELLAQASAVVQKEQNVQQEKVSIAPIVQKTERLLMKFRDSFIALAHGGVQLDQEALGYYVEAAQQFEAVSARCQKDPVVCGELNTVLETLKPAQSFLEEAFGQNPEIYQELEAKFAG